MALSAAAKRHIQTYGIYLAVAIGILAPLLMPGYILTLDMVFTPTLPAPEYVTSSWLFQSMLHYASLLLPSQLIQKALLFGILLLSSIGMHRLLRTVLDRGPIAYPPWNVYAASMFYTVNPFTYDRFMAGQYAVLLGYALLPWFVRMLYAFSLQPTLNRALRLGLLTTAISVISLHTLGLLGVLLAGGIVACIVPPRPRLERLRQLLKFGFVSLGLFIAASSYWLLPLLAGKGRTAETIGLFTSADSSAFATTGHNLFNQLVHIARLQGFWAEDRQLFDLPQQLTPFWGLFVLALWVVIGFGIRYLWKQQRRLLVWMGSSCIIAASLAIGAGSLAAILPIAAGYREPQKFVAVMALCFAVFLAAGGKALVRKYFKQSATTYTLIVGSLLLLPVLLTPTMFWGFAGQLRATEYPKDWYEIEKRLQTDSDHFSVLFLPWHQYMSYSFSGRIIASPAGPFFSSPVITSDDPELDGAIATTATTQTQAIGKLLQDRAYSQLGTSLQRYNIKYILLAKELDYERYKYLEKQQDIQLIKETKHLKLYRNEAWKTP